MRIRNPKIAAVFFLLIFVLISEGSGTAQESPSVYQEAVDCLGRLDLTVAYKRFEGIIRFFPETQEAKEARWWRMLISSVQFSGLEMMRDKYAQAVEKSTSNLERIKNLRQYLEISGKVVEKGGAFVDDTREAFKNAGFPIKVKSKKEYDSLLLSAAAFLPLKRLEEGHFLSWTENKSVEEFQYDASYRYMMGKVLGLSSKENQELVNKGVIEGNVNWSATFLLVGNWLLHYGEICRSGWLSSESSSKMKSLDRSEKGFQTAKSCFEKVLSLPETQSSPSLKAQAEERIKDLDKILKSLR